MRRSAGPFRGERGIALLLVLLVTTLLMALIFEFFYATRVSMREVMNFRDGTRAYFLARSGVNLVGKLLANASSLEGGSQAYLEQRDFRDAPIEAEENARLQLRWEDEEGKINISNVTAGQPSRDRLERLFGIKQIDLNTLDRIEKLGTIHLVDELHRVMKDEDFLKIQDDVTVYGSNKVDINTASSDVLQSLGLSSAAASMIIDARKQDPFTDSTRLSGSYGLDPATLGSLEYTSNTFFVQSYATVGGYTKQANAVINRSGAILYCQIL